MGHSPVFDSLDILTLGGSYWDHGFHLGHLSEHLGSRLHLIPEEEINLQPRCKLSLRGSSAAKRCAQEYALTITNVDNQAGQGILMLRQGRKHSFRPH